MQVGIILNKVPLLAVHRGCAISCTRRLTHKAQFFAYFDALALFNTPSPPITGNIFRPAGINGLASSKRSLEHKYDRTAKLEPTHLLPTL
jgi:hypothetical protein